MSNTQKQPQANENPTIVWCIMMHFNAIEFVEQSYSPNLSSKK